MHRIRGCAEERRVSLRALCLTAVILAAGCAARRPVAPPEARAAGRETPLWETIVRGKPGDPERLATVDLQRYLARVTGTVPAVIDPAGWRRDPRPAVLLGTPETNDLLRDRLPAAEVLGPQGYSVAAATVDDVSVVVAAGHTSVGAVNAVYGLLRELGYGFYLGSEAVPESLPAAFPAGPLIRRPAFEVRGVLPWHNFFNGPTAWDPVDYRAVVDQLIRIGANMIAFHAYDDEPLAAFEQDGMMTWGRRLANTGVPTWGTHPMPTGEFAFGTALLYPRSYFGAETTVRGWSDEDAVRREKRILREALAYARARGLMTGLGFTLSGDPTRPADREQFLKRLDHLIDYYPSLDFIFLWQQESLGARGYTSVGGRQGAENRPLGANTLELYGAARRVAFRRIVDRTAGERPFFQDTEDGRAARAAEGARLEQFGWLAWRAVSHRRHPPRVVMSGWGGDERLLAAEYYEGLDALLPGDIVFSSLDHIVPRTRVDAIYHQLPPERVRWPIPWLEYDGDQWHPQPNVRVYEALMRDAMAGGSQGILGIHWRTREIEENFAYMAASAWEPGLTVDGFFEELARRCYPSGLAPEMAALHAELDALGYRWVGGSGQSECGVFSWGPGAEDGALRLRELRDRAAELLPQAGRAKARLEWLIDRMNWVLRYREAEVAALKVRDLLTGARNAEPEEAVALASRAQALLDRGDLPRAMRTYAERLTTRGEYGVLATINVKAAVEWIRLERECDELLGKLQPDERRESWDPDPAILLPRFLASVERHRSLRLYPVVLGGGPAWLHYRPLGANRWRTVRLRPVRGWVRCADVAPSCVEEPGLEFGFSFRSDPEAAMDYGPTTVTVFPPHEVDTAPRAVIRPRDASSQLALSVRTGEIVPAELCWDERPGADYFRVYRDGRPTAETAIAFYPDIPTHATPAYSVEAWRRGSLLARSETVAFEITEATLPAPVRLEGFVNRAGVFLRWPWDGSFHTASYAVFRWPLDTLEAEWERLGVLRAATMRGFLFHDQPPFGRWMYRVVPVMLTGATGPAALAMVAFGPMGDATPALQLPLDRPPEEALVEGSVTFGDEGAAFAGGWLELPHQPFMDLGHGMTLDFEFNADSVRGMPVIVCHGFWTVDGWFVQILNGRLVVRTPAGDSWGPVIEPRRWYAVRFVFDGRRLSLRVNGEWNRPRSAGPPPPVAAPRSLVIGQYTYKEPAYAFRGAIRNLAIYSDVLFDTEQEASPPGRQEDGPVR